MEALHATDARWAVSACAKCGHDPDAKVIASWTFVLEREVHSLNARISNVGASRWRYAQERDAWSWLVRAAKLQHRITTAVGPRRLTLTRIYARGQRELDRDNLSGMKPLVDAIVREKLVVDDKPAWLELHLEQERGPERAVRALLEVLAVDSEVVVEPATHRKGARR